jgi:hypothetical protein
MLANKVNGSHLPRLSARTHSARDRRYSGRGDQGFKGFRPASLSTRQRVCPPWPAGERWPFPRRNLGIERSTVVKRVLLEEGLGIHHVGQAVARTVSVCERCRRQVQDLFAHRSNRLPIVGRESRWRRRDGSCCRDGGCRRWCRGRRSRGCRATAVGRGSQARCEKSTTMPPRVIAGVPVALLPRCQAPGALVKRKIQTQIERSTTRPTTPGTLPCRIDEIANPINGKMAMATRAMANGNRSAGLVRAVEGWGPSDGAAAGPGEDALSSGTWVTALGSAGRISSPRSSSMVALAP